MRCGLEDLHVGCGQSAGPQPRRHRLGGPGGVAGVRDRIDFNQLAENVASELLVGSQRGDRWFRCGWHRFRRGLSAEPRCGADGGKEHDYKGGRFHGEAGLGMAEASELRAKRRALSALARVDGTQTVGVLQCQS